MTVSQLNAIFTNDTKDNILYIKVKSSLMIYPDRNSITEFDDDNSLLHVIDQNGNNEYWDYDQITMIRFKGEELTSYEEQLLKPDNKVIRG